MFRQFQKFNPPFMQKIDQHLLLHYPSVWATKIHYVLFFLAAYSVVLFSVAKVYPIRLEDLTQPEVHFWVASIPLMIGFAYWVYQLTLFKVENQFGNTNPMQQLRTQAILLAGAALFLVPPTLYGNWLGNRIAHKVTAEEMVKDIDNMSILATYMNENVNLQPYISYKTGAENFFSNRCLSEGAINNRIYPSDKRNDETALADIQAGLDSYHKWSTASIDESAKQILTHHKERYYNNENHPHSFEGEYELRNNLETASNAVFKGYFFQIGEMLPISTMLVSGFVLLLFVFLKTGLRTFLISCITTVVAWILAAFTTVFTNEILKIHEDNTVIFLFFAFLISFIVVGYSSRNTRRFLQGKKVAISLATCMIPFVPIMFVELMDIHLGSRDIYYHGVNILPYLLSFFSLGLAYLCWNFFFNPQLQRLHATPSQN